MSQKPFISFIVTVNSSENHIKDCLESILSQPIDCEIIVIEHCPEDFGTEIPRDFEDKHKDKIRLSKMSVHDTKSYAIYRPFLELARGDYVQFIDGGDMLSKNCMGEIAAILKEKEPDLFMIKSGCLPENPETAADDFADNVFDKDKINAVSYDKALDYLSSRPDFRTPLWRFVLKKSLFCNLYKTSEHLFYNEFPKSFLFDDNAAMRLFCRANSIYYYDKTIYLKRKKDDGGHLNYCDFYRELFFEFLEALFFVFHCKPAGHKLRYCLSRIERLFSFFVTGMALAKEAEYEVISHLLKENIQLFEVLDLCGINRLEKFYAYIKTHGPSYGVVLYFEYLKAKLWDFLKKGGNCDIYLFPHGSKSFAANLLIKSMGFGITGVFDNDARKHGREYFGVNCYSPNEILNFDEEKKQNMRIVICVVDNKLARILENQLKALGINKRQIIVKE